MRKDYKRNSVLFIISFGLIIFSLAFLINDVQAITEDFTAEISDEDIIGWGDSYLSAHDDSDLHYRSDSDTNHIIGQSVYYICTGTANSCDSFSAVGACDFQDGCSWSFGDDECQGTATSCDGGFSGPNNAQCLDQAGCSWEEEYHVGRAYLPFDTSSLPDDAIITRAVLRLKSKSENPYVDFDVMIYKFIWSEPLFHPANLENHYDAFTAVYDTNWQNTSAVSADNYYDSSDLDISWIDLEGITKYQLRSSRDVGSDAPTDPGPGNPAPFEREYIYSAESIGNEPILRITYTSPVCGNGGAPEPPEVCDDGNTNDCDGCKGDCTRLDNVCGDWIPECGEGCDDGNLFDGDGCSSICQPELPCESHNTWGWALSENIGWISFSCQNCDSGLDGSVDAVCDPTTPRSFNYGVDIDSMSGLLSGYAWSENIGWISFQSADVDVADCPDWPASCQGEVNLGTGATSGWARALAPVGKPLSESGGWDGWIKLSGSWADGVSLNSAPSPSEFEGWAWGDDVVGWISFNDKDFDGSPGPIDYQVMTSLIIDNPPYVESLVIEDEEYCDFSPTGRVSFGWTYQDDEDDNQAQYNLQVATDAGFTSKVIDCIINQGVSPGESGTSAVSVVSSPSNVCNDGGLLSTRSLKISYRGLGNLYFWRVKVKAATGSSAWSDWESGPTFDTSSNPYPKPSFSWNPSSPPAEVEVVFIDESTCYTGFDNCKDDRDTSYEWDFDNDSIIDDITKGDTAYTYLVAGDYTTMLGVTDFIDGAPRTCYQEEELTATLPLPKWREIIPF